MANVSTVVTGAGRGLGRAMAIGLLEAGHNVIAIDRDPQELAALEQGTKHVGSKLACMAVDLTLSDSAKTIIAFAEHKFGPVACLVNCAGVGQEITSAKFATEPVRFWTVGEDIWKLIFAVNADAVFRLERFPLRLNRDSQSGRKGGVSGRDSPSGGCPHGQAVFVGFA
jgi:NAD(P)-dependent dehydrogenase (short-subunit alcohol dehydrogenase family)